MKKNFLRNLAGVLSLALVVTSAAPATAGAATLKTFAVNKSSVVVYLQHAVYKNSFNLDALKLADNALTWTSSNKAVATVSTYGNVVGKKVGTANITLKKAGYAPKVVKVVVKDDAKSVTINNAPAEIAIGDTFDLNETVVGLAGGASSNAVSYTVDDATIASVSAAGVVTPIKAGTIKVTATTKASNGTVTATSAPVSIKIVNKMSAVSQKSYNTISVAFTGVVKDVVKAGDFTVKNASSLMIQAVKAVTFSTDGKTAYLELYAGLTNEKTYDVTFNGVTKSLVANVGTPASVVITGKDITYATATKFDVKLFDANGIEVDYDAYKANLSLSTDKGYLNGTELTLYSIGDVATVKGVYHTYKYDTAGKEVTFETTAKFTAVKVVAKEVTTIVSTVTKTTPDWTKVNDTVALNDTGVNARKLYAKVTYTDKSEATGLKYESTDSTKLIVGLDGALLPVSVGVVVVKVLDANNAVLGTVNVTVGAERKATTVSLDKTTLTLSNASTLNDTQKVKITVKDQYGAEMTDTAATVDTSSTGSKVAPAVTISGNEVSFNGAQFAAGSYVYTITYKGMAQSLTVVVKAPVTNVSAASIKLNLSVTDKNLAYASGDALVLIAQDVNLASYDANGVKIANLGAGYTYSIKKADGTDVVTGQSLATDFNLRYNEVGTNYVKQIAAGTYTVVAYYGTAVVDSAQFTVTNTQALPTAVQVGNTAAVTVASTSVDAVGNANLVKDCIKVTLNNQTTTNFDYIYSSLSTGHTILVKKVRVLETIGTETIQHEVTVNAVINVN